MGQQQVELPIPLTHGPGIGLTIEVFPDSGTRRAYESE